MSRVRRPTSFISALAYLMDLTNLPHDIFQLIIAQLEPRACIVSQRVCRRWRDAFTSPESCRNILSRNYPRAREVRTCLSRVEHAWPSPETLTRVASRYHSLTSGRPRCIEKLLTSTSFVVPEWCRYHAVAPWDLRLQFEDKTAAFHYPDPLWSYDEGLLVFPSKDFNDYVVYDLEAQTITPIAFQPSGKIVRRLRLKDKTLVLEWAESESYHQLNESETVHRHFATAYDLVFSHDTGSWKMLLRNEWKIHFLGMPLNSKDRFFSVHSSKYYVLYLWQPNRSAWGEEEPIEALAIWDISSSSRYRPSDDPTGVIKPTESSEGPRLVRRFSFSELDFYGIRQRSTPTLRNLEVDNEQTYFIQEDHRWVAGPQAGHTLPRIHQVKTTAIPITFGPRWVDECGADGDVNLSFCERASDVRAPWLAPCWRHEEFPYLTITQAEDVEAGVRYCARHCFMLETLSINIRPSVQMTIAGSTQVFLRDDLWKHLLGTTKYKLCGDERWLIGENGDNEIVVLHFDRDSCRFESKS